MEEVLSEEAGAARDAREQDAVVAAIAASDKRWKTAEAVDVDGVRWAPSLATEDGRVLHVHLSEGMPRFVARRLRAAASVGMQVHVAVAVEQLYNPEILEVLSDIDAYTYVVGESKNQRRHYLAAMADLGVATTPEVRMKICRAAWARRGDGSVNQRGRRLEALLAFLLSQVSNFRIFQRNYRNETQEIDIVIQVDGANSRCWYAPGVPFILVEAKNTADVAGAPIVSLLIRKLQTKRKSARLGLLFSVSGFTSDAEKEELRLSESEYCVAMVDGKMIERLIDAANLEEELEKYVSQAMLR